MNKIRRRRFIRNSLLPVAACRCKNWLPKVPPKTFHPSNGQNLAAQASIRAFSLSPYASGRSGLQSEMGTGPGGLTSSKPDVFANNTGLTSLHFLEFFSSEQIRGLLLQCFPVFCQRFIEQLSGAAFCPVNDRWKRRK